MIINDKAKGYFFIFLGIVANANVYIFSKAALNELHISQFGFYWFGIAMLWNGLYAARTCKWSTFRNLKAKNYFWLFMVALFELTGVTAFFSSIQIIDNPAVVSFIGNTGPFFTAVLGIFLLKERFTRVEVGGMALVLIGASIISYKGETSFRDLFIDGAEYALLSALLFAVSTIISKQQIKRLPPPLQSLSRNLILFVFAFAMILSFNQGFEVSQKALLNITIGSLVGPFLTIFAKYNALKYAEASRISVLGSTKGLVVLLIAYIYFGSLPLMHQIYGGIVTVAGVFLISLGRSKLFTFKSKKRIS